MLYREKHQIAIVFLCGILSINLQAIFFEKKNEKNLRIILIIKGSTWSRKGNFCDVNLDIF